MDEPVFNLDYYDLDNAAQAQQYRQAVVKFARRYAEEVNFQAEMATVNRRASIGFYRSKEGAELAIALLENWPEDFDNPDLVSSQQQAEAIQLEACHTALVGIDADWMDATSDEE